jgi:hypothetical protein
VFASVQVTLLTLLHYGYRRDLRVAIQAEARRQRFRRERLICRNWGRTAACSLQVAILPETVTDLVEIVAEARVEQRRVRVAASTKFSTCGPIRRVSPSNPASRSVRPCAPSASTASACQ